MRLNIGYSWSQMCFSKNIQSIYPKYSQELKLVEVKIPFGRYFLTSQGDSFSGSSPTEYFLQRSFTPAGVVACR